MEGSGDWGLSILQEMVGIQIPAVFILLFHIEQNVYVQIQCSAETAMFKFKTQGLEACQNEP